MFEVGQLVYTPRGFGVVVHVEDTAYHVRLNDTRIRVGHKAVEDARITFVGPVLWPECRFPRIEANFERVESARFKKTAQELGVYQIDIAKILSENSLKGK